MGEKGTEVQRRVPRGRVLERGVSRRGFNTGLVKGLVGVAAAMTGGTLLGNKSLVEEGLKGLRKGIDDINQVQVEPVSPKESANSVDRVIDIFYPGISGNERAELTNQIVVTREYMKTILTPQSYQNIKDYRELFGNIQRYSGLPKEVLIGLTLAESRGGVDGNVPTKFGALGPVQDTEDKAREEGLVVTGGPDDERLDWYRALPAAAVDIVGQEEYFAGNLGFAVWTRHMGRDGVKEQIEDYSANKAQSFTNLQEYIKENKITVFSVLQIKNIREELEQPGYDRTPVFVLRVAAAASLYDDLEKLASRMGQTPAPSATDNLSDVSK